MKTEPREQTQRPLAPSAPATGRAVMDFLPSNPSAFRNWKMAEGLFEGDKAPEWVRKDCTVSAERVACSPDGAFGAVISMDMIKIFNMKTGCEVYKSQSNARFVAVSACPTKKDIIGNNVYHFIATSSADAIYVFSSDGSAAAWPAVDISGVQAAPSPARNPATPTVHAGIAGSVSSPLPSQVIGARANAPSQPILSGDGTAAEEVGRSEEVGADKVCTPAPSSAEGLSREPSTDDSGVLLSPSEDLERDTLTREPSTLATSATAANSTRNAVPPSNEPSVVTQKSSNFLAELSKRRPAKAGWGEKVCQVDDAVTEHENLGPCAVSDDLDVAVASGRLLRTVTLLRKVKVEGSEKFQQKRLPLTPFPSAVSHMCFSRSGLILVVGCTGGQHFVFAKRELGGVFSLVHKGFHHKAEISAIDIATNRYVLGSVDGTASVWNISERPLLHEKRFIDAINRAWRHHFDIKHDGGVSGVAISPDEDYVITSSTDKRIRVTPLKDNFRSVEEIPLSHAIVALRVGFEAGIALAVLCTGKFVACSFDPYPPHVPLECYVPVATRLIAAREGQTSAPTQQAPATAPGSAAIRRCVVFASVTHASSSASPSSSRDRVSHAQSWSNIQAPSDDMANDDSLPTPTVEDEDLESEINKLEEIESAITGILAKANEQALDVLEWRKALCDLKWDTVIELLHRNHLSSHVCGILLRDMAGACNSHPDQSNGSPSLPVYPLLDGDKLLSSSCDEFMTQFDLPYVTACHISLVGRCVLSLKHFVPRENYFLAMTEEETSAWLMEVGPEYAQLTGIGLRGSSLPGLTKGRIEALLLSPNLTDLHSHSHMTKLTSEQIMRLRDVIREKMNECGEKIARWTGGDPSL